MQRAILSFVMIACLPLAAFSQDKIATELESARAAFAKQLEDSQKKLLASVDAEIEKAAKSGSLESVKSLRKEKLAVEADFDHESKATRLRPAIARYRAEVKTAKDKLKSSLAKAVTAYTKELKISEAESIDAELKLLDQKAASAAKPSASTKAAGVKESDLKSGIAVLLFARLKTQVDNEGFLEPEKLGKPVSEFAAIESLENWTYDASKNAVAFGYLKIDDPGEYEFQTYNFYDRNALLVGGRVVCPYRGSVTGGSEPLGKERIALQRGYVPIISVGYVDARGSVAVTWKPPGQKDFSPIPKELLFYDSSKTAPK